MTINWVINFVFFVFDFIIIILAFRGCFFQMKERRISIYSTYAELENFHENEYDLKFEDIDNVCNNNKFIKEAWNNFKGTITRHVDSEGQHKLYSTISACEFFRLSDITSGISYNYWQNLGGIFTGIGIFGTFLGLVIGLWGLDLSTSDVAVLKEGIGNLLSGISVAFITSLVGIFFALIYGGLHHYYEVELQKAIDILALRIESMYPRKTTEQWLSCSFRESQEQTRTLKNLSQDVAEQLGEVLDSQLSSGFDELCEKLDNQMKPVFDKLCDTISALGSSGVSAIADAVNEKAGTELQAFANIVTEIQKTMQESIRSSKESTERANQILETTMTRFSESMTEGTEDATKRQQSAVDSMAGQIKDLTDTLSNALEKTMASINAVSVESKSQLKDSMDIARNATTEMMSNMKAMTVQQSAFMEKSSKDAKARIDDTMQLLQNTLNLHNNSVDASFNRIKSMMEPMDFLLSGINASVTDLKDSAAPVREATIALKNVINDVSQRNEEIQKNFISQIKALADNGMRTETNIKSLIFAMNEAEKRSENAWREYQENFDNVSGELKAATDLITDKLGQYNKIMNEGMNKQLESFDKSVTNVIAQLGSTIDELKEIVEELSNKKETRG